VSTDGPGGWREAIRRAETFPQLQNLIGGTARGLVGSDGATFVLREGPHCFYVDEDAIAPLWKGQRFPLENCISGWAMLHRETAVVPDITIDERIPLDAYLPTFVRALAMVPVGGAEPIGAIGAYWSTTHHASDEQVARLRDLAEEVARAIERIGLENAPWAPSFSLANAGND